MMTSRRERIALSGLLIILIGMPVAILSYQRWLRPAIALHRIIDIVAAAPEAGGFQPNAIQVEAGETVTLRFTSNDVTHGIAIGPGVGIDLGHVDPGHVVEVTLTFDQAGTYSFYCNSWCSLNHWRMRGVIDVAATRGDPTPTPFRDLVIEALATEGVDIDAGLNASSMNMGNDPLNTLVFERRPSAVRGAKVVGQLITSPELRNPDWRRSHTPVEGFNLLREANLTFSQLDLTDATAYLWVGDFDPNTMGATVTLYNKNCAACHGQTGDGKGPVAGLTIKTPAVFSDPARMFMRRSDVLYAKIRRGGMGTDMPNFGTLFTPEETWALVDYLWTFPVENK